MFLLAWLLGFALSLLITIGGVSPSRAENVLLRAEPAVYPGSHVGMEWRCHRHAGHYRMCFAGYVWINGHPVPTVIL